MPRGDVLWRRLESARLPELRKLGEIVGLKDLDAKPHAVLVEELSKEIRSAAGHSLLNLFRNPHEFPYKQMLIDVADKLAPGWTFHSWTPYKLNDHHTEREIEDDIWSDFERKMKKQINEFSPEKREELRKNTEEELRNLGYSEALVTQIGAALTAATIGTLVGPALAFSIALNTASGLAWLKLYWAGSASLAAILGAGGGVFALIYLPVLGWWLGNTAYRKTIPAALYLIQIRKLREIEDQLGDGSVGAATR